MKWLIRGITTIALFAGVPHVAAQLSFAPAVNYTVVTNGPVCVAAADVNGDGYVDLICANHGGLRPTLMVLTNNGYGVFGSNATFYTYGAGWVLPVDIKGDGKVDLVCACSAQYSHLLMVFTNNGSGVFGESKTNYNVGLYASWVQAADVNGDGKVDLITTGNSSLLVLTNAGDGTFALASSPGVATISAVAVADVNGDGKVDLIEAISSPARLLVLTNGGNGTFSVCSSNASPTSWPGNLSTVDVNGDGKVAVIVPDYSSTDGTTLTMLTNDGSGILGSNATYSVGHGPYNVTAADVDGDGKVDLIVAGLYSSVFRVLTNNGSGGFGSNTTLTVASTPSLGNGWVTAADINGDGKLDLITGCGSD